MNKRQKALLIGMILGDAYLQKTGKENARIRLEHSEKQRDYLIWKVQQFPMFFQGKPKLYARRHPITRKIYRYIRWQSHASPKIGKFRSKFYDQSGRKIIPKDLASMLTDPIGLSVWYMDDGHLYHRDKVASIYMPTLNDDEQEIVLDTFIQNFDLYPKIKTKKRGECVLAFSVKETRKLISLVQPHILPMFSYKLLNPVSTEA